MGFVLSKYAIISPTTETNNGSKTTASSSTMSYEPRELFGKTVTVQIPNNCFPTDEQIQAMDELCGPNCRHGWYEGSEAGAPVNLHYRYWLPSGGKKPKGVVVFTHGILSQTAHSLRVGGRPLDVSLVVDTFLDKGFAVYAKDMYGHGLSEGTRFFIPSWTDARNDAIGFAKFAASQQPTDIPLFIMGESFGGCLTILTAKHFQEHPEDAPSNFDSSLLVCPAIEADLPPFPVYQILRYILAPLFPTRTPFFMPDTVSPERIWRDPKVCGCYQDEKHSKMQLDCAGAPLRLGTAVGMLLAMDDVKTYIPSFATPFCIVHGDSDEAVPIVGSETLFEGSSTPLSEKEFHPLSGCYHGVLADPKAEEAMKHLSDFVDSRLKQFVPPK